MLRESLLDRLPSKGSLRETAEQSRDDSAGPYSVASFEAKVDGRQDVVGGAPLSRGTTPMGAELVVPSSTGGQPLPYSSSPGAQPELELQSRSPSAREQSAPIRVTETATAVRRGPSLRRMAILAAAVLGVVSLAVVAFIVVNRGEGGSRNGKRTVASAGGGDAGEGGRGRAASSATEVLAKPLSAGDATVEGQAGPRFVGSATESPVMQLPSMAVESSKPEQILVRVSGLPRDALVRIDGSPASSPLKLRADGKLHRLSVSAAGYLPYTKEFIVTASLRDLAVRMKRDEREYDMFPAMAEPATRRRADMEAPVAPTVPRVDAMKPPPDKTMSGTYANPFD